jgi:putative two-component system response regulator
MAIADVYDALTDERQYKEAFPHEVAVDIIREESGEHFDPQITDVFLKHEAEFNIRDKFNTLHKAQSNKVRPTIRAIAGIVGSRSGKAHGHIEKMQRYLEIFVNALMKHKDFEEEVSTWDTEMFYLSAQLHDVGKLTVSDQVLNKKARLTTEEFEHVKSHTDFGVKIIQHVKGTVKNGNALKHAEAFTGSHHEKWDGTGYPSGLKGKNIPLQGRIMAITDVYDALTTDRPHRKRKTHEEAVIIIKNGSGTQFDPELVDVFLECEKEFAKVEIYELQ